MDANSSINQLENTIILFKDILDSNPLAKYLNNWQPKPYTKDWNAFGFDRRPRPLVNLRLKELWDLQEMKVCVVVSMGKVSFSLGKTLEWSWTPEELVSKVIVYKSCNKDFKIYENKTIYVFTTSLIFLSFVILK